MESDKIQKHFSDGNRNGCSSKKWYNEFHVLLYNGHQELPILIICTKNFQDILIIIVHITPPFHLPILSPPFNCSNVCIHTLRKQSTKKTSLTICSCFIALLKYVRNIMGHIQTNLISMSKRLSCRPYVFKQDTSIEVGG